MGIQTSSVNNGPTAGFKNAIINGNFDIWQRGTSGTLAASSSFQYASADRWGWTTDGSAYGTRTISQQSFTLGQTEVPNNPKYFCRFNQSVAPTGATFSVFGQRIESVSTFAGQQVTVSFWAKASSSTTLTQYQLEQRFGSGGSPSAGVITVCASTVVIGTTWTKYTATVTLPSVSGKTLGTNGDDNLSLIFVPSTPNGTFTIDIAQVQLERGPVATTFERRPIGTELGLCQRYCARWDYGARDTAYFFLQGDVGIALSEPLTLPTPMRVSPSGTFVNASSWNIEAGGGITITDRVIRSDYQSGKTDVTTFNLGFTVTGTTWTVRVIRSNHNSVAASPYIILDSELFS